MTDWKTILAQLDEQTREAADKLWTEMESKLKQAREEAAERRNKLKTLKEQLDRYERALVALGHDPEQVDPETLEAGQDKQQQDDLKHQWEVKQLKKQLETLERERDSLLNEKRQLLLRQKLGTALSGFELIDRELVEQVLSTNAKWLEDELVLRVGEDELPLEEGVKTFLAARPHLLKPKGTSGTGQRGTQEGGIRNPFSSQHFDLTEQARLMRENPQLAQQLKQQAEQEG